MSDNDIFSLFSPVGITHGFLLTYCLGFNFASQKREKNKRWLALFYFSLGFIPMQVSH